MDPPLLRPVAASAEVSACAGNALETVGAREMGTKQKKKLVDKPSPSYIHIKMSVMMVNITIALIRFNIKPNLTHTHTRILNGLYKLSAYGISTDCWLLFSVSGVSLCVQAWFR